MQHKPAFPDFENGTRTTLHLNGNACALWIRFAMCERSPGEEAALIRPSRGVIHCANGLRRLEDTTILSVLYAFFILETSRMSKLPSPGPHPGSSGLIWALLRIADSMTKNLPCGTDPHFTRMSTRSSFSYSLLMSIVHAVLQSILIPPSAALLPALLTPKSLDKRWRRNWTKSILS